MSNVVTIEFENSAQADTFMDWFSGQGEQDYFTVAEVLDDADTYVSSFYYDNLSNTITGKNE